MHLYSYFSVHISVLQQLACQLVVRQEVKNTLLMHTH